MMKKKCSAFLVLLFCMMLVTPVFPAHAQESDITVTVYNYRDIKELAPFLAVRNFYDGVTTEQGGYSYHEGTSENASSKSYPLIFQSGSSFQIFFNGAPGNGGTACIVREFKFNGTDTIYVTQDEYPGGVGSDIIDHYSISWNGTSFVTDRLHTDGTREVDVNYFQTEDGTSSYYQETPEKRPVPSIPVEPSVPEGPDPEEPDKPVVPGENPDIYAMMNVYLKFSVSILTRIAENPILSFILACPLICICLYVLQQIKHVFGDSQ